MTRRPAGFTLIELLLAIGMVALLMASVYAGMATAFRAKLVVNGQTETLRQAQAALDLAEQDLRSILPPNGTFAGPFLGTPGGQGDTAAATIDCYSLGSDMPVAAGATNPEGMRHVQLALAYDGPTPTLTRTVTRDLLGANGGTPEVETLAKNVQGFDAKYYDGANWNDSWDSTAQNNALPLAVELTVTVRSPTATNPEHVYHLSRVVPFACGMTPDQAAAAASSGTSTGTDSSSDGTTGGGS